MIRQFVLVAMVLAIAATGCASHHHDHHHLCYERDRGWHGRGQGRRAEVPAFDARTLVPVPVGPT